MKTAIIWIMIFGLVLLMNVIIAFIDVSKTDWSIHALAIVLGIGTTGVLFLATLGSTLFAIVKRLPPEK